MIKIKKFDELSVSELYEIMRLRQEVFILEQTCLYPDLDNLDQKCWHAILYREDDGAIAGYLRIIPAGFTFDTIAIGRVLIREDMRHQELARKLLLTSIDFIKMKLHENHIKLSAQQYLIDFYKSAGFEIISEGYLEDGIPHIDMELV